jgi:hypothetical protein
MPSRLIVLALAHRRLQEQRTGRIKSLRRYLQGVASPLRSLALPAPAEESDPDPAETLTRLREQLRDLAPAHRVALGRFEALDQRLSVRACPGAWRMGADLKLTAIEGG